MTDLAEVERMLEAATPGEWQYRPDDDWGWIRAERRGGLHPIVAIARAGRRISDEQLAEHRQNKTDPYADNARLIAAAPGIIRSLLSALKAERERTGKMEAALERLIADYSDVPDATDTEAQQAFADARAALGGGRT